VDLDSIADELYALPPEEFVATRDAAARRADEPDLKKTIKALRRPTVSADAVNRIVRQNPDGVEALLALGEQLRTAMAGKGGDVRALSEQRRALVADLVPGDLPANVRDDVTATLEAATADPQLAEAVRSGRLVKPLRYAGFGEFPDLADVMATPLPTRRPSTKKPAAAKGTEQASPPAKQASRPAKQPPAKPAEPDLGPMRQRVLELSGVADDAQRRYDESSHAVVEARELLSRAEKERAEAHKAARAAHAEAEKARRELGRLERR
jgi:hypothetical protein